jgi:chorismate mutase
MTPDDTLDEPADRGEVDQAITKIRQRLDALDAQLVVLLNERASCARDIGLLKDRIGLEVYQPDREIEVLNHVRDHNRGPLDAEAVTRVFERIIDEARRLERQKD